MGYVGISPKLCLLGGYWLHNVGTMPLTLNYVCVLGCWEEPSLSPGVLKRTLSHIWLRLYLPMFWFNVGLFTLMKIDSLIVLACPCPPCLWCWNCLLWWCVPFVVCACGWWRVASGVPYIFLQESWLSPLCILHHKLCDCTGNCRLHHSFLWIWSLGFMRICLIVVLPLK